MNSQPFSFSSNCYLQTLSVWKSKKFVIWERVNYIILSTNDPGMSLRLMKKMLKRNNMLVARLSPFPTKVSDLSETNQIISATFDLLTATAVHMEKFNSFPHNPDF